LKPPTFVHQLTLTAIDSINIIRMTWPDIPSPSGVKQDHQLQQQDTNGVDPEFIPAKSADIENIPD
jgi:hypothetical protein